MVWWRMTRLLKSRRSHCQKMLPLPKEVLKNWLYALKKLAFLGVFCVCLCVCVFHGVVARIECRCVIKAKRWKNALSLKRSCDFPGQNRTNQQTSKTCFSAEPPTDAWNLVVGWIGGPGYKREAYMIDSLQCPKKRHWWRHHMETFPRYWLFMRGIRRSPVNSPHKGQWCGALMLSLICVRMNGWVNNREAGDLRRHRAHYDVTVMEARRSKPWRR